MGWRIFPLHGITPGGQCTCGVPDCRDTGKHPRVSRWPDVATSDKRQIKVWAEDWPDSNWALACGRGSGVVAIDVDPRAGGEESLCALERVLGPLAETVTSLTGGGGQHYLFQWPDTNISNRVSFWPGIDIRSERGYIVLPPSRHKSGRRYEWEIAHHPEDVPIAQLPNAWLSVLATKPSPKTERFNERWKPMPIDEARRIAPQVCARLRQYISPLGATQVTYEEWVAMASWAHALTDDSRLFHEWSMSDVRRYDYRETERKWHQTAALHPVSCQRIQHNHPMQICAECLQRQIGGQS
ncbi:bifunctional DNA primase/polymerase [Alicyclobacillus contaminans]|uniref:bifunctional DNA primase/polymerase n=1 Tax=Alicyclobacillus contaminans TaxID=392016 RepID=UPI0024E104F0